MAQIRAIGHDHQAPFQVVLVADLQIERPTKQPNKNMERHYNRVVGWLVGWLVVCIAGYNPLIPF